jgi:predicted  nucleic acid-binding Zn-ribbon protein
MSNDIPDSGDGPSTTTSFEEWLDQHAATQGISREELFERLVSSYWTLNELMQLLDDSGSGNPSFGGASEPTDESGALPIGPERTDPTAEAEHAGTDGSRNDREAATDVEALAEELDTLGDRVDELQSTLEAEAERGRSLDQVTETIATRLAEVESELEGLASESEATRESLTREYESLSERVETIESELDRERETRATEQRELATEQKEIRSRLDSEFDNLETILKYLVSQTDELGADLASAESRYEDALSRIRREQETLASLKRDAAAADAHAGECESCGETVDLDLLSRPYCPHCEEGLTGVEKQRKWLLFSDTLVTTDDEGRSKPTEGTRGQTGRHPPSQPRSGSGTRGQAPSSKGGGSSIPTGSSESRSSVGDHETRGRGADSGTQRRGDETETVESETAADRTLGGFSGFDSAEDEDVESAADSATERTDETASPFEFGDSGTDPRDTASESASEPSRQGGRESTGRNRNQEDPRRRTPAEPEAAEDAAGGDERSSTQSESASGSDSPFGNLEDLERREGVDE